MGKNTKKVKIGGLLIGGGERIAIQSMTNTNTADFKSTIAQIKELELEGCELVRVTVPDEEAAEAIKEIKKGIKIPLVADIHFDYRLAIKSIENGIDKLRLNPGNIGSEENVRKVVERAKERGIPIRIGVNGGSLEKDILQKYGHPVPEAMVESALRHVAILERNNFEDIVISIKSSNVRNMVAAYRMISAKVNYPLHIGVTEAGTFFQGSIKSSIGIGSLLIDDIGDTMRVSLTENPIEEIKVGREILKILGYIDDEVEIVSCPTCGRTQIDLINLAKKVEKEFGHLKKKVKIAVMGCVVNGPGEAKESDFGVAGGNGVGVLFKKGEVYKTVKEEEIIDELRKMIEE